MIWLLITLSKSTSRGHPRLSNKIRRKNSRGIEKGSNFLSGVSKVSKILASFRLGNIFVYVSFGIVHQVNLEYIARVVFNNDGILYPDSVVGTDSHTPMINGLGIVGWGVGGIEAEAVMMGEATVMVLPEVIGFKLTGKLPERATATDLVLLCTKMIRKKGAVDKFVEFFGPGVKTLTVADRATISNMAPEYGATIGFFPVD